MGKRKNKILTQDAFAFDASQFGDTIRSPEIKPMKKKKTVRSHNPQSIYQQWEFNDLTQPSQPIARYKEDSPPPSPPSLLTSPAVSPSIQCQSPVPEQLSVEKVPNEPSSVEVPDFIPAMITQPNTQKENSDKICITNIKPKNRTCRMDANIPKLFSTKSANKKVIKTTKDIQIRLSQEQSHTKEQPRSYSEMFRRSYPHNNTPQPCLKGEILREVGLIHKDKKTVKHKAPVSIISKAINKQMSGKRPKSKKKVRYEKKKESPAPRKREYKAIPLQIVLTKQDITLPQRQLKAQQQVKKLPPLKRKPLTIIKSSTKAKKHAKPRRGVLQKEPGVSKLKEKESSSGVSKLKEKEVVYCPDSEDECLTGYAKRAKLKVSSIDYSSQLEFRRGEGVKAVPAMLACADVSEEFTRVQFEVSVLRRKWGNDRWGQTNYNEH